MGCATSLCAVSASMAQLSKPPLVRTATPGMSVATGKFVRAVCCVRVGCLPESQFYDWQPIRAERVADVRGDVLGGRILVDDVVWFAEFCQDLYQLVVSVQYETVVQVRVDPGLGNVPDIGEVDDHAAFVWFISFDVNFDASVVAV